MKLTAAALKRAHPGSVLNDATLPGFHARVGERGPVFYYRYRFQGQQRRRAIGQFPTLSIEDAREVVREWVKALALGRDPGRPVPGLPTVADLKARWDRECAPHKKRTSRAMDEAHWQRILIRIGDRTVASITHDDVSLMHADWHKTPTTANRRISLLSTAMNRAELWGMRPAGDNPCRFIQRYREKKRRRVMTEAEARKVCGLLRAAPPRFAEHVAWILLLILTGMRKNEFRFAKLADIRETAVGFVLDMADSKTDEKTVQISPAAMQIIREIARPDRPRIFSIRGVDYFWNKILRQAGIADLHIHDLRRTFASVSLTQGFSLSQVGQLLGHSSPQTTARYAWLMDMQAAQATGRTAQAILALMEGNENGET